MLSLLEFHSWESTGATQVEIKFQQISIYVADSKNFWWKFFKFLSFMKAEKFS